MAFNINEFRAITNKRGLAKTNHFVVMISPPAILKNSVITDLPFLCETSNLPGSQFATDEVRYSGYGLAERRPSGLSFDNITLTVIGDARGEVLKFLEEWRELIYPIDEEKGNENLEMFSYPSEYWGTLEIYLYDITGEKYITYTMKKAYPVNIAGVQVGWEQVDTLMKIPVTFDFRNYTKNSTSSGGDFDQGVIDLVDNKNIEKYNERFAP